MPLRLSGMNLKKGGNVRTDVGKVTGKSAFAVKEKSKISQGQMEIYVENVKMFLSLKDLSLKDKGKVLNSSLTRQKMRPDTLEK